MLTLQELNKVLKTADSGQWLYIQNNNFFDQDFCVTNGYWDKFYLVVVGLFSGWSTIRLTRQAVNKVLQQNSDAFIENSARQSPLLRAERVQEHQTAIRGLSKVALVWNRSFNPLPELNPWTVYPLTDEVNARDEVLSILPRNEAASFQQLGRELGTTVDQWLEMVTALRECKRSLMHRTEEDDYLVASASWHCRIGEWRITPKSYIFKTSGNYQKPLFYLEVLLDTVSTDTPADVHVKTLIDFLSRLEESQLRPLSIIIQPVIHRRYSDAARAFMSTVADRLGQVLQTHREYFVHQTSLYVEASFVSPKNGELCFTHIAHGGKIRYLSKERPLLLEDSTEIVRQRKAALESMADLGSHNFVVRLQGKEKGCTKQVLLEAFPLLNAREAHKGALANFDPNLLNLDQLQIVSIPPGHDEWILNALVTFAYTGEHPNLPFVQTPNTRKALAAYNGILDYLRPGVVAE